MSKSHDAEYLAMGSGDDPENRSRLDAVRRALGEPATWEVPPHSVAEGVLAEIGAETNPFEQSKRSLSVTRLAAAAFALGAIVVVTVLALGSLQGGSRVVLTGTDLQPLASGIAWLQPTDAGWEIRIDIADLPPADVGYYYEGWVWSDEGDGVSIGTFHLRNGPETLRLWAGVDVLDYPEIWISRQVEGGGAEASEEIVMRGRLDPVDDG